MTPNSWDYAGFEGEAQKQLKVQEREKSKVNALVNNNKSMHTVLELAINILQDCLLQYWQLTFDKKLALFAEGISRISGKCLLLGDDQNSVGHTDGYINMAEAYLKRRLCNEERIDR